jgi:hypothetical protein
VLRILEGPGNTVVIRECAEDLKGTGEYCSDTSVLRILEGPGNTVVIRECAEDLKGTGEYCSDTG